MIMKFLALPLWLMLAASLSGQAQAQEEPVQPVSLTAASVDKFIATFPALASAFSKADPEFDPSDSGSLAGQISLMVEGDPEDSALDAAAMAQGYASFDEWGLVAVNILLARLWAQNPPDPAEIAASEAEITALTDVSEDEKKEMIQGLHEAAGLAQDQKPSDGNIELARQYLEKLDGVLGTEE